MKTVTLRLTLEVRYNRSGVSVNELKDMLASVVTDALSYGGFTGETPATVDEYRFSIQERKKP